MAEYPANAAKRYQLFDGTEVFVRPVRREDAPMMRDFIERLSPESRYYRFQKSVKGATPQLVDFLVNVDYDRHIAYVVVARNGEREELVGEARYVAIPEGGSCEFGIVIGDDWRSTGIAGILMETLFRSARAQGIAMMESTVLSYNSKMLRFARALGFTVEHNPGDWGSVRIVKKL